MGDQTPRKLLVALEARDVGVLPKVKVFAVARYDVAVFVVIVWQGRLQRACVPRSTVTARTLKPRDR